MENGSPPNEAHILSVVRHQLIESGKRLKTSGLHGDSNPDLNQLPGSTFVREIKPLCQANVL